MVEYGKCTVQDSDQDPLTHFIFSSSSRNLGHDLISSYSAAVPSGILYGTYEMGTRVHYGTSLLY